MSKLQLTPFKFAHVNGRKMIECGRNISFISQACGIYHIIGVFRREICARY